MSACQHPLHADHFMRVMRPTDWAGQVLAAASSGWPMPHQTREIALRIQDKTDVADSIAAAIGITGRRNSADMSRKARANRRREAMEGLRAPTNSTYHDIPPQEAT